MGEQAGSARRATCTAWPFRFALALACVAWTQGALAVSNNPASIAGRTPKGASPGCGSCHGSAADAALGVAITGPRILAAGTSATYQLTATKSGVPDGTVMGAAIAASGSPTPLAVGSAMPMVLDGPSGELIHATSAGALRTTTGGSASYSFTLTMPAGALPGETRTLYAIARLAGTTWQLAANYAVTTPLATPTALQSVAASPDAIALAWTGGGPQYRLVYKPGTVPPATDTDGTIVDLGATTATTVPGLAAATQYAFALYSRAVGDIAFSAGAATVVATTAASYPYPQIHTVAGGGVGDGARAQAALLAKPYAIAREPSGSILFTDSENQRVRRIDAATGDIGTVAGSPYEVYAEGVPATRVRLGNVYGLARDAAGNLYVSAGNRVLRVDGATGVLTRIAGSPTNVAGDSGDAGPATSALLRAPRGLALDADGNLYIADTENHRVRRVDATTGTITTYAGDGFGGYLGDGVPAGETSLNFPTALAVEAGGSLLIVDSANRRVRRVAAGSGTIATVAGDGSYGFGALGDGGPATAASFDVMGGIAVDGLGLVYVGDGATRVRRFPVGGTIATIAGTGGYDFNGDGNIAIGTTFNGLLGIVAEPDGGIVVTDTFNARVRRIAAGSDIVSTIAGNGTADPSWGDGGLATGARMRGYPESTVVDSAGFLRIADVDPLASNSRLRGVDPFVPSRIVTLSGTEAPPSKLKGLAADAARNLYYADSHNHVVRRYDTVTRAITVAMGAVGEPGYAGDGAPAAASRLASPTGIAIDAAGHLYVADSGNRRVRKLDAATGLVSTVAGNGQQDPLANGVPATSASLVPLDVAVDPDGNLYVADALNLNIRRVDAATQAITSIAGNGSLSHSGDGDSAANAGIGQVNSIATDIAGNLYLANPQHHRVRKVDRATQTIATVAGTGVYGTKGDYGNAFAAETGFPTGLSTDANGNVYLGEATAPNARVRRVSTSAAVALSSDVATTPQGGLVTFTATVADGVTTPAGFVSFVAGGAKIPTCGAVPIGAGIAQCSTTALAAGAHAIRAVYSGTPTTLAARSAALAHTVAPPPPQIAPSPGSLDFGGQSAGTTSPAQAVTITNTGGSAATVLAITASAGYAVSHACTTIAAGASCTASVTFAPSGAGMPFNGTLAVDGTLTIASDAPASPHTVALSGTAEKSLVTHYYRAILRRAPDAGGKAFWTSEAARVAALGADVNETWYAMAQAFYGSAEYAAFNRDAAGFVTDLYNTFFNRAPDGGGLSFWTGLIAQGMPREVVLASFMFSAEFRIFTQAIFGNATVRGEVDTVVDFYRGLLGRLPDDGGFAHWVGRFRAAQCAGNAAILAEVEAISSLFATSPEYAGRSRSNTQYIGDLYNAFLRRGGDLDGVQFWIGQLGAHPREAIRVEFRNSAEFQARVAAIVQQGCL